MQTTNNNRILIVDDLPNATLTLAAILAQLSMPVEILTANNGKEALDLVGDKGVDVLIVDFLMPGMTGLELIEKLRADGRKPGHTILMTASNTPGLNETASRMQIDNYLVKPVDPAEIQTIVSQAIKQSDRPKTARPKTNLASAPKILVADDNLDNVNLLIRYLKREGYSYSVAHDGVEALQHLRAELPDLLLLDVNMPKKNGFEVLQEMRADPEIAHIPVIIITAAMSSTGDIAHGLKLGADDYMTKPFSSVLLRARVSALLVNKYRRDMEQVYLKRLQEEQERSEQLLLNILPQPIAEELKRGQDIIVEKFQDATILFADIVGFTEFTAHIAPETMLRTLNTIFLAFDNLVDRHQLEKIKTIGDAYMVAGGLPVPRSDHVEAIADMALDMQVEIAKINARETKPLQIRIGIHTGPVIAGVIGAKKFAYDLWGDSVNTASRMERYSVAGGINVSQVTYERLRDSYEFEERGAIDVKGKGAMLMYLLTGRKTSSLP